MTPDSEIERHLRAMLLVVDGLQCEHRDVDWDALRQMVWHAQTIAKGIEDQRRDDADELEFQRRERDRLEAELETVKRLTQRDAERMNRLLVFVGKFRYILNFRHGEQDEHLQDLWGTLSGEDAELAVMANRAHEAPTTTEIEEQSQEAMRQMSQEAMQQMSDAGSGFGEAAQCPDA
jgi:hypothetical protein